MAAHGEMTKNANGGLRIAARRFILGVISLTAPYRARDFPYGATAIVGPHWKVTVRDPSTFVTMLEVATMR